MHIIRDGLEVALDEDENVTVFYSLLPGDFNVAGWLDENYIYKRKWELTSSARNLDEAFLYMKFTLPKLSDLSIVKSTLVFRITAIILFSINKQTY